MHACHDYRGLSGSWNDTLGSLSRSPADWTEELLNMASVGLRLNPGALLP
jgi:hypothetical protein